LLHKRAIGNQYWGHHADANTYTKKISFQTNEL
jgi:hypothetical protein